MRFPAIGTYVKKFRGKTMRRQITLVDEDGNLIRWFDPDAKVAHPRSCNLKTWNGWLTAGGLVLKER